MSESVLLKERIAHQFSRAAIDYDKVADVQYDIAQETLRFISQPTKRMLDVGCGTGRVSQQLLTQAASVVGLDLSLGMIQFAKATYPSNRLTWLNADVEHIPMEDNAFDGVFSSMMLQWCKPLDKAFSEIYRVMESQSEAVISLMSRGSFFELNHAWKTLDQDKHTNDFLSHEVIVDTAEKTGFSVSNKTQLFTSYHNDILQLLGAIKGIGANTLTSSNGNRSLNKKALRDLECAYRSLCETDGQLPLTYHISFLRMRKS